MIIKCKCGKQLTTKLGYKKDLSFVGDRVQKGFMKIRQARPKENQKFEDDPPVILPAEPESLVVPEDNILVDVIPEFKTGMGCCNHDRWVWWDCPSCGNELGSLDFDCWGGGVAYIIAKNVIRCYK